MSNTLRPGASRWRKAATVVLAAGWGLPGPVAVSSPTPPAEGFRLLLTRRSQGQGFLPGAYVFPGGVLHAADSSADWQRLFAPHHLPPRFGLSPTSPRRAAFPVLPEYGPNAGDRDPGALPDDVALRICAIRETFEEAGVLLLRPRGAAPDSASGSRLELEPVCAFPQTLDLAAWRSRVHSDPRHFLTLCMHLDCTPDIWKLHDWSTWLTPFMRPGTRRFDTAFFLCCIREPPSTCPDMAEVVGCKVKRDDLYLEDSDYIENALSSKKTIEEFMKESKAVHRVVLHDHHLYSIHVTVQSKYKHVYPKTYVVDKSRM
ncbi:nucleoside diphosphate-linked moiety X motif 19 [Orycteropus afer afer]|uniref:Nucleoside diphosphate-linked moiety X motif 19 n=1 Tax=Orycteropus afer afer TaxID=1230840 RepID=A0A8B7B1K5_ORYAF|nr:nucleoside diphosphate-linked moiety X motif 19 [Orycteropus afer afer]